MKEACRKDIKVSGSPLFFWDHAAKRRAEILSLTVREIFQLQGINPYTADFGEEDDI